MGVLEALLWRSNSVLAISEHGARSSVYDEAKAVVKKNKATPEEVEIQLTQYHRDGLPQDKRFNGKKGSYHVFFFIELCFSLLEQELHLKVNGNSQFQNLNSSQLQFGPHDSCGLDCCKILWTTSAIYFGRQSTYCKQKST